MAQNGSFNNSVDFDFDFDFDFDLYLGNANTTPAFNNFAPHNQLVQQNTGGLPYAGGSLPNNHINQQWNNSSLLGQTVTYNNNQQPLVADANHSVPKRSYYAAPNRPLYPIQLTGTLDGYQNTNNIASASSSNNGGAQFNNPAQQWQFQQTAPAPQAFPMYPQQGTFTPVQQPTNINFNFQGSLNYQPTAMFPLAAPQAIQNASPQSSAMFAEPLLAPVRETAPRKPRRKSQRQPKQAESRPQFPAVATTVSSQNQSAIVALSRDSIDLTNNDDDTPPSSLPTLTSSSTETSPPAIPTPTPAPAVPIYRPGLRREEKDNSFFTTLVPVPDNLLGFYDRDKSSLKTLGNFKVVIRDPRAPPVKIQEWKNELLEFGGCFNREQKEAIRAKNAKKGTDGGKGTGEKSTAGRKRKRAETKEQSPTQKKRGRPAKKSRVVVEEAPVEVEPEREEEIMQEEAPIEVGDKDAEGEMQEEELLPAVEEDCEENNFLGDMMAEAFAAYEREENVEEEAEEDCEDGDLLEKMMLEALTAEDSEKKEEAVEELELEEEEEEEEEIESEEE